MGLLLFLSFSLLFTAVSPLGDISKSSCSSKFEDELHQLNDTGVLRLPLHHPRGPCSPAPLPPVPFSDVLAHDEARVRSLAARLSNTSSSSSSLSATPRLLDPTSLSVPLSPGTSLGVGNYVTRIGLGFPSSSYAMVVDTGSSLTWLQCSPCVISCHAQSGSIYDPSSSSSYRSVSCSAPECGGLLSATLNPSACTKSNVCIYQASYGDSSFSVGYLSKDTIFFNSQTFPNFVYGCGQDNEGLFGKSAGLIGLARNKLSLLYQLSPRLGYSFSYCLPTTSSTGFLSIGGGYPSSRLSYTPLVSSSLDSSLYFVRLVGINVAGKSLSVPASAFTSTPTIIDSGTVITRLPSDVYSALSKAVAAAMRGSPRASAYSILDTCFKGSFGRLTVPQVDLVFQGGAALRLAKNNVMIDVDGSTTCLAFAPAGSVAIIGNTQQQTFTVVYDVGGSKLGFAPGGCR
ncbi:aspartyl protease family protein At5g10770-like [Typha latifolia]|uniref:aspartyl protease family protein At5g10770-like n=1 Tax=Typha latifolia TaxID=4733 RepID=UPI003C2E6F14